MTQVANLTHGSLTVLTLGIVVDRSKLPTTAAELGPVLASIYSAGTRVVMVDNINQFFRSKTLIDKLENGEPDWDMIAEHLGVRIGPEEVAALNKAVAIRQGIRDAVKALKGPYPFVDVPEGYDLNKRYYMTDARVQNKETNYQLSKNTAERVWKMASAVWAGVEGTPKAMTAKIDYSTRTITTEPNLVRVGCQNISRLDVEQIAQHYGWDIPAKVV